MLDLKERAAAAAVEYVLPGMRLGLGTGTTAQHFIRMLGEKLRRGLLYDIQAVPTSQSSSELAQAAGIPTVTLESLGSPPCLDLAVDGADEVDPQLNLIKGLGKALLREKFVELHARRLVIIVDESKLVTCLGRGPLPVEVVPFEAQVTLDWLTRLAGRAEWVRRPDGSRWVTDNANLLALLFFPDGISDPYALSSKLLAWPGVVEHGLFLDMTDEVIVSGQQGLRRLHKDQS